MMFKDTVKRLMQCQGHLHSEWEKSELEKKAWGMVDQSFNGKDESCPFQMTPEELNLCECEDYKKFAERMCQAHKKLFKLYKLIFRFIGVAWEERDTVFMHLWSEKAKNLDKNK